MAAAVVCATAVANAGAVNWASGLMKAPGEGGALSSANITSTSGFTVTMYAWESLSDISFSAGDLYKWYTATDKSKDPFGGSLVAKSGTVNMNTSITQATVQGSELTTTGGTTVYGAVLFVLADADTGNDIWYMENSASVGAKAGSTKASVQNLASIVGGGSTGTATAWTAVPEPTSGLLMLLGVAGLALKRKRA